MPKYSFLDDYSEGAHPSILQAMVDTNLVQQTAYGNDAYSIEARDLLRKNMGTTNPDIWFVTSGTLANILCISCALRPYEAVIAPTTGHIVQRETGAIEAVGYKTITVAPKDGKLTPEGIQSALDSNRHFPHMAKPRLVYISNATEFGTLYTKAELIAISTLCHDNNLLLLIDGARMGAALTGAKNDLSLSDVAELADIFWIGGTKVGALMGEAIVIPNEDLRTDFDFLIKQKGTLLAKGRILGLQFRELFRDNLFFQLSSHANEMATKLSKGLKSKGIEFASETETNQLFPILENAQIEKLKQQFDFYVWEPVDEQKSVTRFVTSWVTSTDKVEELLNAL